MNDNNIFYNKKGILGEQYASKFLKDNGYKIIFRNFRSAFGEIDIIAEKKGELYFCEVKTRWNLKYGIPQESVTRNKLLKIKKTIDYFLLSKRIFNNKLHILVISQIVKSGKIYVQNILTVDQLQ